MPEFFLYLALVFIALGVIILAVTILRKRSRKAKNQHA
jgi:hypothetical protein